LEFAEKQGVVIPSTCRGGACASCLCKLLEGPPPDQSEQSYLTERDLEAGFILLCVALPTGACTIQTHVSAEFLT